MFKKISFFSLVLIIALSTSACFKKQTSPAPLGDSGLLGSLAKQSQLKKISSAADLKTFFENRPNLSASAYVMSDGAVGQAESTTKAAAPMGLGAGPADMGARAGGGTSPADFSNTNIQVAGVDESDIVKTDGRFIYVTSNKTVTIVTATPAKEAAIASTIKLDGQAQELFVDGDRLVAFGYDDTAYAQDGKVFIRPVSSYTFLNIYDIADRKNPKLLKALKFEGNYTASRLIDHRLYFISSKYNFLPAGDFVLPKVLEGGQQISSEQSTNKYAFPDVYYVDGPFSYNATTVSLINLNDLEKPLASQVYLMPAGQTVYASLGNLYLSYTKYVSDYQLRMTVARDLLFNRLSDKEKARIAAIDQIDSSILSDDEKVGKVDQVIQSYFARLSDEELKNVLQQLDDEFSKRYDAIYKELEKTVIHKIKLDGDTLNYQGSGEVVGHVLNQFSMDEYEDNLRIATTRGQSWIMPFMAMGRASSMPAQEAQESYNNMYVLDAGLKTIGQIEELAVGERIYSVRFMGERAYVVTFKQVDPLFIIDLSKPESPTVTGQLKIPGFSSYLHPYDDKTLIGIGKEVIDNGDKGVDIKGLKISLFDVSDIAAPKEIFTFNLGGRGSDTSALYDHKAFLFSADKKLMVLPVNLTKVDSTDYNLEFQGAVLLNIQDGKIVETGRVWHIPSAKARAAGFSENPQIQRTLYIGDYLYSLSPIALQVNDLNNLSSVHSLELPLPEPFVGKPIPLMMESNIK